MLVHARIGVPERYRDCDPEKLQHRAELDEYVRRLVDGEHDGRGLFLYGPFGTGKSRALGYVAACAYEEAAAQVEVWMRDPFTGERLPGAHRELDVLFCGTGDVVDALICREHEVLEDIRECEFLCLDDLGATYEAPWMHSWFTEMFEYRYARRLPIAATSNLTPKQLGNMPEWSRVADRLREAMWCLGFEGPTQRTRPEPLT